MGPVSHGWRPQKEFIIFICAYQKFKKAYCTAKVSKITKLHSFGIDYKAPMFVYLYHGNSIISSYFCSSWLENGA